MFYEVAPQNIHTAISGSQLERFQSDVEAINRIGAIPTILDVVCRTTGMGFAAVARVTEDRWITCQVLDSIDFGLEIGDELEIESTFCHEIRQNRKPTVINHVAESERYRTHHIPQRYGFQSYISVPIVLKGGRFFGTLCAVDPCPAQLENPETIGMFTLFAQLTAAQLDAEEKLVSTERQLVAEQNLADIREQFIAILGHDLRNPLAALQAGTTSLSKADLPPRAVKILDMMQGSVRRMINLTDNLLDFARGRLGGGLGLARRPEEPLLPALQLCGPDRLRPAEDRTAAFKPAGQRCGAWSEGSNRSRYGDKRRQELSTGG